MGFGCTIIMSQQNGPTSKTSTKPPKPASSNSKSYRYNKSDFSDNSNCSEIQLLEDDTFSTRYKRLGRLAKLGSIQRGCYQGRLLVPVALVVWCIMAALGPPNLSRLPSDETASSSSVVAANEMFDEANETPGGGNDGFNDDDDDDDGAMDSAASSDYPEADGGGGADDPDDDPDGGESRRAGTWMLPGAHATKSETSKRWKRDIDDRASELQRRRAVKAKRRSLQLKRPEEEEEFSVDDGDEDAWVHDGVDDIHIDPETKQAASQLSHETDKSIDAEYEPYAAHEQDALVNGTRVTTIAEVIPMRSEDLRGGSSDGSNKEPTRVSRRFAAPPRVGASLYLPAAYLSMDQVVRLMDSTSPSRDEAATNDD